MKKFLYITICCIYTTMGYSQIAINTETPDASAVFDIESTTKGIILPRLTTTDKETIVSPATGLIVYDTTKKCLSMNIGSEESPNWICATQNSTHFFYMPSINVPTPSLGVATTPLDLYAEYKKQFDTPMYKSTNAPAQIPYYQSAKDLDYYVTYYDSNVMNVSNIDNTGKMSYHIIRKADLDSYMNVVFVVK